MKKRFLIILLFVVFFCVCLSTLYIINYVKRYNLIEDGVFLNNLSEKDKNSIINNFEISNMKFVSTEYIYYRSSWREDYLVAKMIIPNGKADLFEKNFSDNWMPFPENQESLLDTFTNWWDIQNNENFVALYANENLSENPTKICILVKYERNSEMVYYLYTDIYDENVFDIVKRQVDQSGDGED